MGPNIFFKIEAGNIRIMLSFLLTCEERAIAKFIELSGFLEMLNRRFSTEPRMAGLGREDSFAALEKRPHSVF